MRPGIVVALLWLSPAAADHHVAAVEEACFEEIQGRIAWNYEGDRRWNHDNLLALCRGTRRSSQPGICFDEVMHGGLDWGGGTRWEWENAVALCRGTSDARYTVGCFRDAVARGGDWRWAIDQCAHDGSDRRRNRSWRGATSCHEHVQGRIAWNYQGDRVWEDRYLDALCQDSRFPEEPGSCYQRVMHGGVDWGGGTRWQPDNVLDLCAGTEDAQATIHCFEDMIHRGHRWDAAIERCRR